MLPAKPDLQQMKEQRDYAWSYFQLHANQRMTSFNFFVVIAALLTTGLARTFAKGFEYHFVGVCLGIGLMAIAFLFWKLDQRVRHLIKHAESILKQLETLPFKKTHQERPQARRYSQPRKRRLNMSDLQIHSGSPGNGI